MRLIKLLILFTATVIIQGCVLTKVVTMPMRVGGAVVSVVPGVGNSVDEAIDTAADSVDEIPL